MITGCPKSRFPLNRRSSNENLDRFIPNRSAMDMDFARYMIAEGMKGKQNAELLSPSKEEYRKQLAESLNLNRSRILTFRNTTERKSQENVAPVLVKKPAKPRRHIPQSSERTLDAPDIIDDFYLNLLDWGNLNCLSIALGYSVYLWDARDGSTNELLSIPEEDGPVTSVNWAPDGRHVAVGLNNSDVQLWDALVVKPVRTLRGCHNSRVGTLAWNNHILTTGGMDSRIVNNDVRMRSHIVETLIGHDEEVCGLKWSPSGDQLASGGNDNLVFIWDKAAATANAPYRWRHKMEEHSSAVKALAWCPFQANLLASGGGGGDETIKLWNTQSGNCTKTVDTGSQVCSLIWSKSEKELLSSHGYTENQLTLWRYPSMKKMAELTGHTSRVLFMTQSPDGSTVATAAGDETLRFWNVFGVPEVKKTVSKSKSEIFANVCRIR